MTNSEAEVHKACVQRFIDLANTLKDEGADINIVSAGLMTSSALYTSYLAGGNAGGLSDSGLDKVLAAYKRELERIQAIKKQEAGL